MNIRVIYHRSIYDRNGCAKVNRSFAENEQRFFDYTGHNVVVYDSSWAESHLSATETKSVEIKVSEEKSTVSHLKLLKRRIKSFLGAASMRKYENLHATVMEKYAKSYWGVKKMKEEGWMKLGRNVIEEYMKFAQKDDAFIIHTVVTCWGYIDYCQKNKYEMKKFILVDHNDGEFYKMALVNFPNLRGSRYHKVLIKRAETCYDLCQRIVFVSERSAMTFKEHYPQYADKVRFVYNGIEGRISNADPVFDGKIRMVTVGSVYKGKNQIMQIDCLKQIRKQCDATLTIIGGGEGLKECKQRAKELGVEQWVSFFGSIDGVADELAKCNLFVMSSFSEGLPIAAIEALRAKLPVVLTDVGGCRELIEDNGYLVHPNIDEITDAVVDFGKDVEKQKKMSEASYRLFKQKFTVDAMIKGYSEIIREAFG